MKIIGSSQEEVVKRWRDLYSDIIEDYETNKLPDKQRASYFSFESDKKKSLALYRQKYDIYLELQKDSAEIDKIIGNDEWTKLQCDECGENVKVVVQFNETKICKECLGRGWMLFF